MQQLVRAFVVMCVTVGGTVACHDTPTIVPPTPPPFTFGVITSIDASRGYLVEADSLSSAPRRSYFGLSASTEIGWNSQPGGSAKDLQVGRTVGVWAAGSPLPDSLPPRVVARLVVIYR